MILFVGVALCGGMPLLLPACAVALITRYFYFKYTFIRFNRIPKMLDEAVNERIINYLPFAIIIHFSFSIWMYGTKSLFAT